MSPRKPAVLRDSRDGLSLREHLIVTAADMIAAQGTAGLTVRAIARQAGVADGVLYNHFSDKEELLAIALHTHVQTVERDLDALPAPGTATVAANLQAYLAHGLVLHRAILPAFAGFLAQPAVLARFADLGEQGRDWRGRLNDYLRAERDLGRLAPDAQTAAAAAMIVGVCHEVVLSGLFPSNAKPPALPRTDSVVTAVLKGIGNQTSESPVDR